MRGHEVSRILVVTQYVTLLVSWRLTITGLRWPAIAAGFRWPVVAAVFRWPTMAAGFRWLVVTARFRWPPMAAGFRWPVVAAVFRWPAMVAGFRWPTMAAVFWWPAMTCCNVVLWLQYCALLQYCTGGGGWLQLCTRAAVLHWGWLRRCAGGSAPSLALRT